MVGLTPSKKRIVKILQDVSGVVKPSRCVTMFADIELYKAVFFFFFFFFNVKLIFLSVPY